MPAVGDTEVGAMGRFVRVGNAGLVCCCGIGVARAVGVLLRPGGPTWAAAAAAAAGAAAGGGQGGCTPVLCARWRAEGPSMAPCASAEGSGWPSIANGWSCRGAP